MFLWQVMNDRTNMRNLTYLGSQSTAALRTWQTFARAAASASAERRTQCVVATQPPRPPSLATTTPERGSTAADRAS
jgi:hypothetical protein